MTSPLEALKAKQAEAAAAAAGDPVEVKEEKVFNVYTSTLESHKIIRTDGKVLHVLNHKFITDDPKDIEFLDAEIAAGFPYIRGSEQLTSTDLDPMAKLRAQMKEEARQEILAETKDSTYNQAKIKPASTAALATLSSDSNSAVAK